MVLTFGICSGLGVVSHLVKGESDDTWSITIDTLGYDMAGLPKGVKGKTYPVFDSCVVNSNGEFISATSVLVFYDTNCDTYQGIQSDDVIVPFENNRFPTNNAGVYVIEYTAELGDENRIVRVFVEVLETNVAIDYTISEEIISNGYTGEKVYLPEGTMSYDKRFGKPVLTVSVFLDYGEETCKQVTYYDNGKPYFLPRVGGVYTVEYSVTNILGEQEKVVKTKQINIEDKGQPIVEEPSLSLVAHVGEQIVFPDVEAIEYVDGKIYYLPTVVYVDGEACEDRKYTATESGIIEVYYSSTGKIGGQTTNTIIQKISIQNLKDKVQTATNKEGKLFIDNYFNNENFTTEFVNNKLRFQVENGSGKASFKNAIPVEKLKLAFLANSEGIAFNDVKILLQDSMNAAEKIEFTLKLNQELSDSIDVFLNGSVCCSLSNKSFTNREKGEIALNYTENGFAFSNANIELVPIGKYLDGSAFKGFSSGKAYLSFEINDVRSKSYFELITLADEVVKFMSRDTTYPVFIQQKDFETKKGEKGDIITFEKPKAFDLLDASPRVYIEIMAPDGSYVANFDDDEIVDKYVFTANLSGTYYIRYRAIDAQGNECDIEANSLLIADRQSPIVKSKPQLPTAVGLNQLLKFDDVTFTDNVTETCTTYIYVVFGDYEKHLVEDNKYIFRKEGLYKVVYAAVDAAGNKTEVIYYITCRKGV